MQNQLTGLAVESLPMGPGDQGSVSGHIQPKT